MAYWLTEDTKDTEEDLIWRVPPVLTMNAKPLTVIIPKWFCCPNSWTNGSVGHLILKILVIHVIFVLINKIHAWFTFFKWNLNCANIKREIIIAIRVFIRGFAYSISKEAYWKWMRIPIRTSELCIVLSNNTQMCRNEMRQCDWSVIIAKSKSWYLQAPMQFHIGNIDEIRIYRYRIIAALFCSICIQLVDVSSYKRRYGRHVCSNRWIHTMLISLFLHIVYNHINIIITNTFLGKDSIFCPVFDVIIANMVVGCRVVVASITITTSVRISTVLQDSCHRTILTSPPGDRRRHLSTKTTMTILCPPPPLKIQTRHRHLASGAETVPETEDEPIDPQNQPCPTLP